ncbi:MAG: type II secretion system protein GspC [Synergistes sp.]|nr:type II secretion system protein GspC [Synergistes sp.]
MSILTAITQKFHKPKDEMPREVSREREAQQKHTSAVKEKIMEILARDGSDKQLAKIAAFLRAPFESGSGDNKEKHGVSVKMTAALFVAIGIIISLFISLFAEGVLLSEVRNADIVTAEHVAVRNPSFANAGNAGGLSNFKSANPFEIDPKPEDATETPAATAKIDSFVLQGTLPGIGAWINSDEGLHLILKGDKIGGYTLTAIKYGEVTLNDGRKDHTLFLFLSGSAAPASSQVKQEQGKSGGQKLDFSGVESASGDKEGAVPRELVDALLMNPYDELGKMRMVPEADGSGMRLERIDPDSVFARVGVAKDDVIQAVNGVAITNMADAANAVNSLMAGTRFDVTVKRKGKPLELKYQVK